LQPGSLLPLDPDVSPVEVHDGQDGGDAGGGEGGVGGELAVGRRAPDDVAERAHGVQHAAAVHLAAVVQRPAPVQPQSQQSRCAAGAVQSRQAVQDGEALRPLHSFRCI